MYSKQAGADITGPLQVWPMVYIKTSRHQDIKTSRHQDIKTSRHQDIKMYTIGQTWSGPVMSAPACFINK